MMCPTCNEDTMIPVKNRNWAVCPKCGGIITLSGSDVENRQDEPEKEPARDWVLRLAVLIAVVLATVMAGMYCGWWE